MVTRLAVFAKQKKETIKLIAILAVFTVVLTKLIFSQLAFATIDDGVKEMVNSVISVGRMFCVIIGGLLLLAGFISWGVSHAKGGNSEVSAYVMMASGLILGIIGFFVIPKMNWAAIFNFTTLDQDVWQ